VALLAESETTNACADCTHLLRLGTCGEPEAAGLFPPGHGFGIAWPPDGHAATCRAYAGKLHLVGGP
jgi:hypothetical protein